MNTVSTRLPLASNWWLVALRGVVCCSVSWPSCCPIPSLSSLMLLLSAYMLVDGLFSLDLCRVLCLAR